MVAAAKCAPVMSMAITTAAATKAMAYLQMGAVVMVRNSGSLTLVLEAGGPRGHMYMPPQIFLERGHHAVRKCTTAVFSK